MKRQLRNDGSEAVLIQGSTFKKMYLQITTVGTGYVVPTSKDIDLTKIRIGLQLNQHGKDISSSFNAVGPTALGTLKNKNFFGADNVGFDVNGLTCSGKQLQATDGSTINFQNLLVIPILFNGMSLTDSDSLTVQVDLLSGLFALGNATDDSKVYLVTEEGADVEQLDLELPVFYPLTIDKQSPAFNEESVSEIAIVSSCPSVSTLDFPINAIDVKSLYVNERFDYVTLRSKQIIDQFELASNNVSICDSHPSTLDKVEINLDVDTTKLHTGNEFLYVMRSKHNAKLANRAINHRRKVTNMKAKTRGLMVSGGGTIGQGW